MAYIKSVKALQRVKPFLDELVNNRKTHVWKTSDPKKLAYQLHNAFQVARTLNLPMYADLSARYAIKTSATEVIAAIKEIPVVDACHNFEDIKDVLDAVQALSQLGKTQLPIAFPALERTKENRDILISWSEANGYTLDIESLSTNEGYGYKLERTSNS